MIKAVHRNQLRNLLCFYIAEVIFDFTEATLLGHVFLKSALDHSILSKEQSSVMDMSVQIMTFQLHNGQNMIVMDLSMS